MKRGPKLSVKARACKRSTLEMGKDLEFKVNFGCIESSRPVRIMGERHCLKNKPKQTKRRDLKSHGEVMTAGHMLPSGEPGLGALPLPKAGRLRHPLEPCRNILTSPACVSHQK